VDDSDAAEDRVEVALEADSALRPYGLDADDDDGKIVLKGKVRTAEHKALAEQLAAGAAGGIALDSRIQVSADAAPAGAQPTDLDDVEDRVEDALEADSVLNAFDLEADEDDGRIALEGTVKTADQKARAEQVAARMAPNVTIINRVKVEP
jgi:osmotically-inducible protein OsmY